MTVNINIIYPILISIISLGLGLTALIKSKNITNRYFFFLTIFISLWIICNYLENEPLGLIYSSFFLRSDFILAPFVSLYFLLFCLNFPIKREVSSTINGVLFLTTIIFSLIALTNILIHDFRFYDNKLIYSIGILYPLYAIYHVSYMGYGASILLNNLFIYKGIQKTQSIYVSWLFLIRINYSDY